MHDLGCGFHARTLDHMHRSEVGSSLVAPSGDQRNRSDVSVPRRLTLISLAVGIMFLPLRMILHVGATCLNERCVKT
jgi:hypothetical protein